MKKIMIVDNDRIMLRLMSRLLKSEGYQVMTAEDSLVALDILKTFTPDVMFVDLIMPNIDGAMLCQVIRSNEKFKNVYLIIFSAISAEESIDIAKLGANACIAKGPFDEMAHHVLVTLEQPELTAEQCSSGEVLGIEGIYPRGITQELLSIKNHFELVLERMSDGILEINPEGRIVYANPAALLLIGIPGKDLLGSNFVDLFSGDAHQKVCDLMTIKGDKPKRITEDAPVLLNGFQATLNILSLDDDVSRSIIILNDVSERKRAEEELKSAKEYAQNIIDSSIDMIISVDNDRKIVEFNRAAEETFGYHREEVRGKDVGILYEDPQEGVQIREKARKTGQFVGDITNKRKDGSTFSTLLSFGLMQDKEGEGIGAVGVSRDITDQKRTEEALRESEELLNATLESTADGILVVDENGKVTHTNKRFAQIWRIPSEVIKTRDDEKLLSYVLHQLVYPEEFLSKVRELYDSTNEDFDTIYFKDGRIVERYSCPLIRNEEIAGRVWSFRDITERKQAEKALQESEERLAKINKCFLSFGTEPLENINLLTTLCGELLGATCALYNRLDKGMLCSWGQWETPSDYNPVDKPDGHICYDVIKEAKENILVVSNLQNTPYAKTDPNVILNKLQTYVGRVVKLNDVGVGSLCVVYQNDFVPSEAHKKIIEIIASAIGVEEERMRAEEVFRDSETRYRTVLEASPDPVVVYDMGGKVIYFNPAFTRVFGWTLEERLGKKMDLFVPDNTWPETRKMIDKVLAGENFSGFETRRYTKEGHIIQINMSAAIYKDQDGNPIGSVIILRDITEQKKLEAQLQRAQKMEALGILAGGVAHDLNNVLSGFVSYPDLLLMQIPEDSPLVKPILTMQGSGKKAAHIVQDLLTLARRGVVSEKVVNLNEIISEYLKNPEHEKLKSFHPRVEVETSLDSDLFNILGSPVHLSKTVMNLVSNAAEAMPNGGTILISTENRYVDRPITGYDSIEERDYVTLTVSDTGIGISSEDNERIFEPFYTKKVMGRSGTGLGMAVVWGAVKDHNGYIDVQSKEGKGTTFTLYFPATRQAIAKEKTTLPIENYMGRGESILVVDDAKEQREIVFNLLTVLGYVVDTVSSGDKAIDYMKNNTADLLILDMIMDPGIDGLDTYKKIIEIHPGQKAVIASGFSETGRVRGAQRLGAGQYIKKPYTLEKIGMAVRTELDK